MVQAGTGNHDFVGIWLVFAFEMAVQSAILYKIVKGRSWTKLQV